MILNGEIIVNCPMKGEKVVVHKSCCGGCEYFSHISFRSAQPLIICNFKGFNEKRVERRIERKDVAKERKSGLEVWL